MTLTFEKNSKRKHRDKLISTSVQKTLNDTYIKFFQDGDKVKVIRHSKSLGGFSLDSRRMLECDYGALMLETGLG
jgi:hypothetical protein